MSKTTINDLKDQLQSKVLRNLVDLADLRNCRLVSQKWKKIVMDACQDKFHVVYPLTDSTLHSAHQLKNELISFDVFALSGKENKDAWSKSGIDLLLQTTNWLQFSGSEINPSEIRKITSLASNSLKTLSFICFKKDLTCPFLELEKSFNALRKLSIGFYSSKNENDTFNTFTNTLERWTALDCRVQLPVLESLSLYFTSKSGNWYIYSPVQVTSDDLFRQYIAIAKILLKFKRTLRDVQIERDFSLHYVRSFYPHLSSFQPQLTEMERELEGLNDLNLNRLKLTTKTFYNYNMNGATSEIEVLGRPKNLKNLFFQSLIFRGDDWPLLTGTLSSCNNADGIYLTSLRINLCLPLFPDPTMVINLGTLKACSSLKILCLSVNYINPVALLIRNVELLPKGISVLRFVHSNEYRTRTCNEIILNQQQIHWIINNLREIESFWLSLMIRQQTPQNNDEEIEAADVDENENVDNAEQAGEQEQINRMVNINVDTFRDLLTMPKLKDLRVEMRKAQVAAIHPFNDQAGHGTSLDDIREYTDLCDASGCITTTTTSPFFGVNNAESYATLSIQKNLD